MQFGDYLIAQSRLHPSMKPLDAVKLCYQAAHGAEHLLSDPEAARRYFDAEYASVEADADIPLAEEISETLCRVNLAAWKARNLSAERLFELFLDSAQICDDGDARMRENLNAVEAALPALPFSPEAWRNCLCAYAEAGMPAVHHSEAYRESEKPAYRIVRRDLLAKANI